MWFCKPCGWFWWAAEFRWHFCRSYLRILEYSWGNVALCATGIWFIRTHCRDRNTHCGAGAGAQSLRVSVLPAWGPREQEDSTRGNWGSDPDLLEGWNPFLFLIPENVAVRGSQHWPRLNHGFNWINGLCSTSLHIFISSHKLAFFQTFHFKNSQTYRKAEYKSTMHI